MARRSIEGMSKQPREEDQATASRITALRKVRGLSQVMVAGSLGVTYQQLQKYESGTNRISPERLMKLATLFKVPISAFFDEAPDGQALRAGLSVLLEPDGASDLIRIYAEIRDPSVRREILAIVRSIAQITTPPAELPLAEATT